jgi:hypothetical protein
MTDITLLRLQTLCQDALAKKEITTEEYKRVCAGQGHSESTARQYYSLQNGKRNAYKHIMGDGTTSTTSTSSSVGSTAMDSYNPRTPDANRPDRDMGVMTLTKKRTLSAMQEQDNRLKKSAAAVLAGMATEDKDDLVMRATVMPARLMDDKVEEIQMRASVMDEIAELEAYGIDHPRFEGMGQRVPVSPAEREWLFNYFKGKDDAAASYIKQY